MSKSKLIHPNIHSLAPNDIKEAGYAQLVTLLHKLPISTAANELMVTAPTLYRCLDEALEVEKISVMLAAHIIFMCETTVRLKGILTKKPRNTAYFQHVRHDRIEARKTNGIGATK